MPDPLFEGLYREAGKMNWQPADDVRRRGQRRSAHQRLAVAAAAFVAVVLVTGAAVAFAGRPITPPVVPASPTTRPSPSATARPSPSATASRAPTPIVVTTVPTEAMLRPADAGTGTWTEGLTTGDWTIEFTLGLCQAAYTGNYVPAALDQRDQILERADGAAVLQTVSAYPQDGPAKVLAGLRARVLACARFNNQLSSGEITMTVLAESFAGEQAMLVEVRSVYAHQLNVVVRQGNLLTQLAISPLDEDRVKAMAERAAARLCEVTRTCQ